MQCLISDESKIFQIIRIFFICVWTQLTRIRCLPCLPYRSNMSIFYSYRDILGILLRTASFHWYSTVFKTRDEILLNQIVSLCTIYSRGNQATQQHCSKQVASGTKTPGCNGIGASPRMRKIVRVQCAKRRRFPQD